MPLCVINCYSLAFLVSEMSIPEDIDEQLSLSSFHSGSAKVRYFRSDLEFRVKSEG